jgi:ribosomal protein S18 acetylase RimI-like enzyme
MNRKIPMKITKGQPADIPEIMALISAAVKAMHARGLYQWNDEYPNREIITGDVAAGTLYKINNGKTLAGVVVLNEESVPHYASLKWATDDPHPLIVHRLCIHPDFQGRGLAKKLMSFAEEYALKQGYRNIRLDTSTVNQTALGLYDRLGYRRVGIISFRPGFMFQCFEKGIGNKEQELGNRGEG